MDCDAEFKTAGHPFIGLEIRVVDDEGLTLSAERVELRALLDEEGGPVEAKVRARAGGVRVELALSRGRSRGDAPEDEDPGEPGR